MALARPLDDPLLVSVIIPFYDTPPEFMRESIESVLHQTYRSFEILLIDDGAAAESLAVAMEYSESYPSRVKIYHHPARQNHGISASRQLGIQHAGGTYIAFLDADDVWLEKKLDEQVALMDEHPEAELMYGNTLYWYSWTGRESDLRRDFLPKIRLPTKRVFQPPQLLPLFLTGKTAVPCICSLLIRRQVLETVGGFEPDFPGMYEDQVFYAKISLESPIYVSDSCWDRYRQHSKSMTAMAEMNGSERESRHVFLKWLEGYLVMKGVRDLDIWLALKREIWLNQESDFLFLSHSGKKLISRLKKWLLKFETWVLPFPIRQWIWTKAFKQQ
jgi:glycosyltransferase involved in cell wall biosynthesis